MKKTYLAKMAMVSAFVFALLIFNHAWAATYDATGAWQFSSYNNWVNPGSAECGPDLDYTASATITQDGDSVTIVARGVTYTGFVSGATYTVTASYPEEGGTTYDVVTFTLSSNSFGTGEVTWAWLAYGYSCNGGSSVTLSRADPVQQTSDYTGWWYNDLKPGTGISIELQGETLLLAWYVFNEARKPVWYTVIAEKTGETSYGGAIAEWTGWPLGSAHAPAVPSEVGTLAVSFSSKEAGSITWDMGSDTETYNIVRFMDDLAPGPKDSRDIHGWWFDPDFEGMGVFIECQSGVMALSWYHYREDNTPRWWVSMGGFPEASTDYEGEIMEFAGGQYPGGPYIAPTSEILGDISLQFISDSQAILTYSGGAFYLERFNFASK